MAPNELDELYHNIEILEHSRSPRNFTYLACADIQVDGINPFCGDEIHLQLNLDDKSRISDVGCQSVGCVINKTSGSMLSEVLKNRTLDEFEEICSLFYGLMDGLVPTNEQIELLGSLIVLMRVKKFPIRIKCALLGWSALEDEVSSKSRRR